MTDYAGSPEDQSPDGYMLRQFLWNECELEMSSRLVRHRMNEKVNERLREAKLRKRLILPGMKGWIS